MADKIFVDGLIIKERKTSFGSVLKVSIKVQDFGAFVKKNKKENGWLDMEILPMKAPKDNGQTHYATLDTWEPNKGGDSTPKPAAKPAPAKQAPKAADPLDDDDGSLPF